MYRVILIVFFVSLCIVGCHHHGEHNERREGAAMFSPGIMEADVGEHVKVLASDEFEGRFPGSHGEQLSVAYLIEQFKRIGLEAGNDGSWLQPVPFVKATLQNPNTLSLVIDGSKGRSALAFGTDMVIASPANQAHATLKDSPIVFVGYDVDSPAQHENDHAGLDLRGKTVVLLINERAWKRQDSIVFNGRKLTWYGRKLDEAARRGAAAAFIVHDTEAVGFSWDVVRNNWQRPRLSLPTSADDRPRLPIAGWLTTAAARKLFADGGANFDALKQLAGSRDFKPVALQVTASISFDNVISHGYSNTVVGKLVGLTRPYETVIYSAHWDYLGRDGGRIFHGAVDNAAGVSGMLEIAEAFEHRRKKPQRTVMFLALTMEESGMLGSRYYINHPLAPLDLTVADIDMDALTVTCPGRNITMISYGQSQLDDYVAAAAQKQRRVLTPDMQLGQGFYARNGQFNFARAGVPVVYARSGQDLCEDVVGQGRKTYEDEMAGRYHRETGVFDPSWDLRWLVQDLRLLFMVGNQLSDERTFPQWKAGSDFRRPERERR